MASAQDIAKPLSRSFSNNLSVSPSATFHSPTVAHSFTSLSQRPAAKHLKPFNTEDIKILLLENVNQSGRDILTGQGYQVEFLKTSLPEDQLIEKIR
jgi:D-3-phosphoglycerate dehydrogenase